MNATHVAVDFIFSVDSHRGIVREEGMLAEITNGWDALVTIASFGLVAFVAWRITQE